MRRSHQAEAGASACRCGCNARRQRQAQEVLWCAKRSNKDLIVYPHMLTAVERANGCSRAQCLADPGMQVTSKRSLPSFLCPRTAPRIYLEEVLGISHGRKSAQLATNPADGPSDWQCLPCHSSRTEPNLLHSGGVTRGATHTISSGLTRAANKENGRLAHMGHPHAYSGQADATPYALWPDYKTIVPPSSGRMTSTFAGPNFHVSLRW